MKRRLVMDGNVRESISGRDVETIKHVLAQMNGYTNWGAMALEHEVRLEELPPKPNPSVKEVL